MRVVTILVLGAGAGAGLFAMDRSETFLPKAQRTAQAIQALAGDAARGNAPSAGGIAAAADAMRRVREGERMAFAAPQAQRTAPPAVARGFAIAHDVAAPGGIAHVVSLRPPTPTDAR